MNLNTTAPDLEALDSDGLFLREVAQALGMSPEERFRLGGDLFEFACDSARAGIRAALGTSDPDRIESRLAERLRLQELLGERSPQ